MSRTVLWLVLGAAVAAGCGAPSVPRERITFAVLAGVYYAAAPDVKVEGAMVEDSEALLRKAVADLNAVKDLDFVILAGDLLARADGPSLDRALTILADLKAPYYAVLGENDGPAPPPPPAPAAASAAAPATGAAAAPATGAATAAPAATLVPPGQSRSAVTWALQGRGFSGPEGYWSREVLPGLLVVGLDTVQPGRRGGHLAERQLEWLDRTLSAHPDKAVLVAAYHELMPLHALDEGAAWRHRLVDNAAAARAVLERHPNVLAVLAGVSHFAEGRVSGRIVYLASPSVGIWPLAYHLVRLSPKEAEAVWVPLAGDDLTRRAQNRLLRSTEYRGVFPAGEDGDTACVRLFGGKKMEVYTLPAIRP
jgi:3',5'-cyclic AMP phosphodiesterase CpdA